MLQRYNNFTQRRKGAQPKYYPWYFFAPWRLCVKLFFFTPSLAWAGAPMQLRHLVVCHDVPQNKRVSDEWWESRRNVCCSKILDPGDRPPTGFGLKHLGLSA